MSEPVTKPFRCDECGALVHRAHPRPGATWAVRYGVEMPLPPDVFVPTCANCGQWFVDGKLADLIQKRLEETLAFTGGSR